MKRNYYLIAAAILSTGTALLHLFSGQKDLIDPFLMSELEANVKAELLGVWHMVSILLIVFSIVLIKAGFSKNQKREVVSFTGQLYILTGFGFIIASFLQHQLAPQFILLIPIGVLVLIGSRQHKSPA